VPAWAVAAAVARGRSRLTGAGDLRVKESDRLRAVASNLEALGVVVRELEDGLEIEGGPVRGGCVAAHGDHRIAMAFAALGTFARGPVAIDDASSITTSFPGFTRVLETLGGRITRDAGERAPR
jgi:3-phosphoshikimate 1-carboxyvinyltransferase